MQILIKATLSELINSLVSAHLAGPSRHSQVIQSCTSAGQLAIIVAEYYRGIYPDRVGDRMEAKIRLANFYREHCHILVAKEDHRTVGGFCVLGDELLCLHNYRSGKGEWLIDHAIALGAARLTCFDVPRLVQLYTGRGFDVVKREPNWAHAGPDVLSMVLG